MVCIKRNCLSLLIKDIPFKPYYIAKTNITSMHTMTTQPHNKFIENLQPWFDRILQLQHCSNDQIQTTIETFKYLNQHINMEVSSAMTNTKEFETKYVWLKLIMVIFSTSDLLLTHYKSQQQCTDTCYGGTCTKGCESDQFQCIEELSRACAIAEMIINKNRSLINTLVYMPPEHLSSPIPHTTCAYVMQYLATHK